MSRNSQKKICRNPIAEVDSPDNNDNTMEKSPRGPAQSGTARSPRAPRRPCGSGPESTDSPAAPTTARAHSRAEPRRGAGDLIGKFVDGLQEQVGASGQRPAFSPIRDPPQEPGHLHCPWGHNALHGLRSQAGNAHKTFDELTPSTDVRVVVLASEGTTLSSGHSLREMAGEDARSFVAASTSGEPLGCPR